jgi:hypothetical protein
MNSSYKIVFRLELLHEYYLEEKAKHLSVVPSVQTDVIIRNYDLKWKQSGNMLFVAAKTDNTGKPLKQWPDDLKLVFYILPGNSLFQSITNPAYEPSSPSTSWLSNFSGNEFTEPLAGGGSVKRLYLSVPVSAHVSATVYDPGRLVMSTPTNEVYESVKKTVSGTLLSNMQFWRKRGQKQYVTSADNAKVVHSVLPFNVTTAALLFNIRYFGLNINSGVFNMEARAAAVQKHTALTNKVNVPLQGLSAGRYRIEVNGESVFVVVKDASLFQNPAAVIELYNQVNTSSAFSLLNAGIASDKHFTIRFCNQSVLWKYIAKSNDVTAVTDSSSTLSFSNAASAREFVSTAPYPLHEQPLKTISFTSAIHGSINSLPNASPSFLSEEVQDGDVFSCSTIYLNH